MYDEETPYFMSNTTLFSKKKDKRNNNILLRQLEVLCIIRNVGLSKKMDGIWNRNNLKSTGRIYTFGVLKCSEKFKVLDLP